MEVESVKKDKLYDFHEGQYISVKLTQRLIKRHMMPSSKDIIDYINEVFSTQQIDRGYFSLPLLMNECLYSEPQVKKALAEIKGKEVFLMHKLVDGTYMIFMPKTINRFHIKLLESEKIESEKLSDLLLTTPEIGKLKRLTNGFKNLFKRSPKIEKRSPKIDNSPSKIESETWKPFSHLLNDKDITVFQEIEFSSLDLNSLDLLLIDHHSLEETPDKNYSLAEIKNDDDNFKINLEEIRKQIKESVVTTNIDLISDIPDEPEPELIAPKTAKNFKLNEQGEILLTQFKNLKNKAGINVGFDILYAETWLLKATSIQIDFITNELKYFPERVDRFGNPVGAGYMYTLMQNGSSQAPKSFAEKEERERNQKTLQYHNKILHFFSPGETASGNIPALKYQISRAIKSFINSKKISDLKDRLLKMKQICNISDFLSEAAMNLIKVNIPEYDLAKA